MDSAIVVIGTSENVLPIKLYGDASVFKDDHKDTVFGFFGTGYVSEYDLFVIIFSEDLSAIYAYQKIVAFEYFIAHYNDTGDTAEQVIASLMIN